MRAARGALPKDVAASARERGRALSVEQAFEVALASLPVEAPGRMRDREL